MAAAESHIKTQQTLNSQDNYIMTLKQRGEVTKFYQFLPSQGSYLFPFFHVTFGASKKHRFRKGGGTFRL